MHHYMAAHISKNKPDEVTVYTDLPKLSTNEGTIPADIVATRQRPFIVLFVEQKRKSHLSN